MPCSRSDVSPVLLVSLSARALAYSASIAGIRTWVIDLFGDQDTQRYCERNAIVSWNKHGFAKASLLQAAQAVDPEECAALVYGGGFEAAPDQLSRLCQRRKLLGNSPETIISVKNPQRLSALLTQLGIPFPETRFERPAAAVGWLTKRAGGAGGHHVIWARDAMRSRPEIYWQRHISGRVLSATLLANGTQARLLGFCEQWCDATQPDHPFVYGGAVTIDATSLHFGLVSELTEAVQALVANAGLRGLCGIDFILNDDGWWLIDINPRPSATFELHQTRSSLLSLHLQAMQGHLPALEEIKFAFSRAQTIVYAYNRIEIPAAFIWPAWTSDRPQSGTVISGGEPVCTVHAGGAEPSAARRLVKHRQQQILERLQLWQTS